MPEDHPHRKTPSVANIRQRRAAEEAVHEANRAAPEAALGMVERWNTERSV